MKAMIKVESNGEEVTYNLDNIVNVVYTNDYITFVQNDGMSTAYANKNTNGYNYIISIM